MWHTRIFALYVMYMWLHGLRPDEPPPSSEYRCLAKPAGLLDDMTYVRSSDWKEEELPKFCSAGVSMCPLALRPRSHTPRPRTGPPSTGAWPKSMAGSLAPGSTSASSKSWSAPFAKEESGSFRGATQADSYSSRCEFSRDQGKSPNFSTRDSWSFGLFLRGLPVPAPAADAAVRGRWCHLRVPLMLCQHDATLIMQQLYRARYC